MLSKTVHMACVNINADALGMGLQSGAVCRQEKCGVLRRSADRVKLWAE